MAVFTYEIATDIVLPNITVERQYADGVHIAYRVRPNEGYVLHNPALDVSYEDEFGNEIFEQYYYRETIIPVQQIPSTWGWEAVLESDVPADMIFGVGDNDHEIA